MTTMNNDLLLSGMQAYRQTHSQANGQANEQTGRDRIRDKSKHINRHAGSLPICLSIFRKGDTHTYTRRSTDRLRDRNTRHLTAKETGGYSVQRTAAVDEGYSHDYLSSS